MDNSEFQNIIVICIANYLGAIAYLIDIDEPDLFLIWIISKLNIINRVFVSWCLAIKSTVFNSTLKDSSNINHRS